MYAYKKEYLGHTADTFGAMMDYAVNDCGLNGDVYLNMFITTGTAKQFERGNPKYIAGKSSIELAAEVIQKVSALTITPKNSYRDYRTPEYWAGWALAQYQWYTTKSYASILRVMPFADIVQMHPTLHEADITKFYAVAEGIYINENTQTNLKIIRTIVGLSQAELAKEADVSLRSIQMYEQCHKDINKAQAITLFKIALVLGCDIEDLIEPKHSSIETELMRIKTEEKAGRVSYITLEEFERETEEILRIAEYEENNYK